jgi:hypothetical protein
MQATTVTRELIQSVGDHVYHQGASYKSLSPTKGTRNAEIIYQAIKNMPDNTVVRADFNAFGKPYIFFPKREKKTNKETISTINSRAERNELSNILHTIATSSAQQYPRSSTVHGSVLSLNLLARSIPIARDFVAGDLKKDLGLLAETHRKSLRAGAHAQVVAKHGTTGTRSTKILDQRLRQFRDADSKVLGKLATLLSSESNTDSESSGLIAALAMRRLVREYLKQPAEEKKSLAALIKSRTTDSDLLLFAKLWTEEMKGGDSLLCDHSWAHEMDGIARLILGQSAAGYDGDSPSLKSVYMRTDRKPTDRLAPGTPEDERLLAHAIGLTSQLSEDAPINSQVSVLSQASPHHQSGYLLSSPGLMVDITEEESGGKPPSASRKSSAQSPDSPYIRITSKRRVKAIMQQNAQRPGTPTVWRSMGGGRRSAVQISTLASTPSESSSPDFLAYSFSSVLRGSGSPLSPSQLRGSQKSSSFKIGEVSSAALPFASGSSAFSPSVSDSEAAGARVTMHNDDPVTGQYSDADE